MNYIDLFSLYDTTKSGYADARPCSVESRPSISSCGLARSNPAFFNTTNRIEPTIAAQAISETAPKA